MGRKRKVGVDDSAGSSYKAGVAYVGSKGTGRTRRGRTAYCGSQTGGAEHAGTRSLHGTSEGFAIEPVLCESLVIFRGLQCSYFKAKLALSIGSQLPKARAPQPPFTPSVAGEFSSKGVGSITKVIEGVKDTRSTDGGERADNEGQAEGDAATQEAESIPRHINDPADTKAGGDAKAKASSVATRWKGEIRKMIGGAKAHIHIHEDVDLRRRLGLSRNCKTRQKIDPCTTLVEFDGSHPVLGVDRQGRFLYLYLPEWMPADIHEHYYAVAAHFILGRDLGDCERKKRQARQSSRKRRKTAGVAVQTPRNAVPSNPNLPELGDDNVDSVYRHLCEDTSCYCQNNKCGSFHCGIWCQQGHPKNPDRPLAPTANLACNPSIKGGQAVLDFNQRTTLLHRMINYVVACIEPWTAATLLTAMEKAKASNNFIASQLRDITTMFFGYAFMLNKQTQNHRDQNSAQLLLDVLATLGEYEGGALRLPELGVKAHYGPRTLFLLRGGLLKHGIEDFDGRHRICMAYFAHQSVLTNLDIRPFVPRKIVDTKKSRPVFRSDAVDKDTWQAIKDLASMSESSIEIAYSLELPPTISPPVSATSQASVYTYTFEVQTGKGTDGRYYDSFLAALNTAREVTGKDLTAWRDAVGDAEKAKEFLSKKPASDEDDEEEDAAE
ncbi:hypothetical protein FRB90_008823 [Tulasnella sp. 427]|nr:hypothetical protein FRB90_008823 [Tulasnella sp. 427]